MENRYDVVVIGGGVAGLATGALLAKAGKRVAVLEKGNQIGGRAYTYVDQGFVLNYGPHGMYRPQSGLLADLLKRLEKPLIAAPVPAPRKAYFSLEGRWGAIGTMPQDILTTSLFPFGSRLRIVPLMATIRFTKVEKLPPELTLGEWLDEKVSDPALREFAVALATINSYTRPARDLSARFLLRHLQRTMFEKDYVGYMSGGWKTMYGAFESALTEHGGEIVTGTGVERLIVEDGRVVAALATGQRYEAGAFVLTLPPQDAPDVVDEGTPLRDELERWRGMEEVRAVCIDLGFSRRLRTDLTLVYDVADDLYFSLHSEVTPDLAPEGGQLLHAMAYLSPEEASDESASGGRDARQATLIAGLDKYFAGWRDATVVQRTLPNARVSPARQTPQQQGAARMPARSSTATNLYFAGDARDLPYNLSEISLASAMEVADLIAQEVPVAKQAAAVG
ncbi:MAG: FAD-dependent oxidoreductase [Dehalococcoidia bacterium]